MIREFDFETLHTLSIRAANEIKRDLKLQKRFWHDSKDFDALVSILGKLNLVSFEISLIKDREMKRKRTEFFKGAHNEHNRSYGTSRKVT